MARFVDIPADLRSYIVDYVPSQRDRVSLAKTCQAWYDTAIAAAYKHVHFNVDTHSECVLPMLAPENAGLKYLRRLTIRKDVKKTEDVGSPDPTLDHVIQAFASLLPKDQMLDLRIDTLNGVDAMSMFRMHKRQRNLRTFRFDGFTLSTGKRRPSVDRSCLSGLTSVDIFISRLYAGGGVPLNLYRSSRIKHLSIHFDFDGFAKASDIHTDDRHMRNDVYKNVLNELFRSPDPSTRHGSQQKAPIVLSIVSLALRGVDLSPATHILFDHLQVEKLESVTLQHCENVDTFVARLTRSSRNGAIKLRELAILNDYGTALSFRFHWVNGLLKTLAPGLRTLVVAGVPKKASNEVSAEYLAPDALVRHAATLKCLYIESIDLGSRRGIVPHHSFLENGLAACTEMEQLAISFPRPFVHPCPESQPFYSHRRMKPFLKILSRLSKLVTLSTLNVLPSAILGTVIKIENSVTALATGILADSFWQYRAKQVMAHIPQLNVLTIGRTVIHSRDDSKYSSGPRVYIRAICVEADGRRTATASFTDLRRARDIEPAVDILNVDARPIAVFRLFSLEHC